MIGLESSFALEGFVGVFVNLLDLQNSEHGGLKNG